MNSCNKKTMITETKLAIPMTTMAIKLNRRNKWNPNSCKVRNKIICKLTKISSKKVGGYIYTHRHIIIHKNSVYICACVGRKTNSSNAKDRKIIKYQKYQ